MVRQLQNTIMPFQLWPASGLPQLLASPVRTPAGTSSAAVMASPLAARSVSGVRSFMYQGGSSPRLAQLRSTTYTTPSSAACRHIACATNPASHAAHDHDIK